MPPPPPPQPRDVLTVAAGDETGLLRLDDPIPLREQRLEVAPLNDQDRALVADTVTGLQQLAHDREQLYTRAPAPARRGTGAATAPPANPLAPLRQRLDVIRDRFRREVTENDFAALTPRQRALRTALHTRIAREALALQQRVRNAAINQWDAFERGCLLSAVAHWARLQLNESIAQPRLRLPAGAPYRDRVRVAALLPDHPLLRLYLFAERQLLLLTRCMGDGDPCATNRQPNVPETTPPAWAARSTLSAETARALTVLAWTCGNGGDLTPPIVHRRLRSLHRHMTGAVAWSVRWLEYARALRLDTARRLREELVARHDPLPAGDPDLLVRTLAWLNSPDVDRGRAEFRATRNRHLNAFLRAPLIPDPCPPSLVTNPPAALFELFPEMMRRLLEGGTEPAPPPAPQPPPGQRTRTRRPPRTNEDRLDELWCWYHDHKAGGYLLPGQATRSDPAVAFAETRWINLVTTMSNLYDRLADGGFEISERRVGVSTYAGHGVASYDLSLPPRAPIHIARPAELYIGRQVLGDDPGAPRGRYRASGWDADRHPTTPFQETWDKWEYGMLGRNFDALWERAVRLRRDATAAVHSAGRTARQQYLAVFRRQVHISDADRAFLIDTPTGDSAGGHPRVLDASRFLAGLFFEGTVLDTSYGTREANTFRSEMRLALHRAVRDVRPHSPLLTAGWSDEAWEILLEHCMLGYTDRRGQRQEWQEALLYEESFVRELFEIFLRRGFHMPRSPSHLPEPLRNELTRSVSHLSASARAQLRQAFVAIVDATREVMAQATATGNRWQVHRLFVDYLAEVVRRANARRNRRNENDPDPAADEDGTSSPEPIRLTHRGGGEVDVHYRYDLVEADDGSAPNSRVLWVKLSYTHMASTTGEATGGPPANPNVLSDDHAPLIGLAGATGNAASPHAHLILTVAAHHGPRYRSVGLISPFDFLGPLEWEDRDSTGPEHAPLDETFGPAPGASWMDRTRDVRRR